MNNWKEDTLTMKEYKRVINQNVQLKEKVRKQDLLIANLRLDVKQLQKKFANVLAKEE